MKRIFWFDLKGHFSFAILAVGFFGLPLLAAAQVCTPAPAGLISWYRGQNNLIDTRGGHNGTSPFNPMTYAAGKVGQAFDLQSVSASNRWDVPDDPGLNPQSLTIEGWIKTPGNSNNAGFIASKSGTDGNSGFEFFFGYPVEGNRLRFDLNGGAGGADLTGNITIADNTFHHVAATYDGATIKLYVDGVLDVQKSVATTISYAAGRPFVIGDREYPDVFPANMPGIIDELSFYNRALSQGEIQAIVGSDTAGKCGNPAMVPVGLVSWYPGDGNALDLRSRNDGAPQNGTTYTPGAVGQAFGFNGIDQFVEVPYSNDFDFTSFTIDAWVNTTNLAGLNEFHTIVSTYDTRLPGSQVRWVLGERDAGKLEIDVFQDNNTYRRVQTNDPVLAIGAWRHFTATFDMATQASKIYLDGVEAPSTLDPTSVPITSIAQNTIPVRIGALEAGSTHGIGDLWTGQIDETSFYNRALSPTEVASIYNAGAFGKIRPTATVTPAGLVGFWAGDGSADDVSGNGDSGVLSNGAGFAAGKVGQGFLFDGVDDRVTIPDANNLDLLTGGTIETWIYANNTNDAAIIFKGRSDTNQASYTWGFYQGNLRFDLYKGDGSLDYMPVTIPAAPLVGSWNHIAVEWDTSTINIFVNGVLVATQPYLFVRQDTVYPITLGQDVSLSPALNGRLDEVSIYDHPLTTTEIRSIYNAGLAGKLKTAATVFSRQPVGKMGGANIGGGVNVVVGDATVSFAGGSGSGVTQEIPIDMTQLPPLPMGVGASGAYDVATSAAYTGGVNICFNLPMFTPVQFAALRIFHLENGAWVNRTAAANTYSSLCTTGVTSLSPFAIGVLAPTAANISVSGRVYNSAGNGLSKVRISVTDTNGETRTVMTSALGYYRFEGLTAGQTYVISVAGKQYQFIQDIRVISAPDSLDDVDFIAN